MTDSNMLSTMLNMVAPHIRSTLDSLLGTLDLMERSLIDAGHLKLLANAEHSVRYFEGMLGVAVGLDECLRNTMSEHMQVTSLEACIAKLEEQTGQDLERKGVNLVTTIEPGIDDELCNTLYVDEEKLVQALSLILAHACVYTRRAQVSINISAVPEGGLSIVIRDNGLGMTDMELFRLFSLEGRSDDALNGFACNDPVLDMGALLAKLTIQYMQGQLVVDSQLGLGTTWAITLPSRPAEFRDMQNDSKHAPQEHATRHTRSAPQQRAGGAVPALLLVDDSPSNRLVLKAELEFLGYTVVEACDGLEALVEVRANDIAAVLMDLAMPKMDGITAARAIRAVRGPMSNMPLIALTAHTGHADEQACLDAGFDAFLSKPIDRLALKETLLTLLSPPVDVLNEHETLAVDTQHLLQLAQVIGDIELETLLRQFALELIQRMAVINQADLESMIEVRHNLFVLVQSAGNFGFSTLARNALSLREQITRSNWLRQTEYGRKADLGRSGLPPDFCFKDLLSADYRDLQIEVDRAIEFLHSRDTSFAHLGTSGL